MTIQSQSQSVVTEKSLSGLVLVALDVHMWSGSRRLKKASLIAKNPELAKLPPENLATLGGTKICDPKDLAPNRNRKTEALKLLSEHGLPFMKGFCIPDHKWDFVYKELVRIQSEFNAHTQKLYLGFDDAIQRWRDNPENKEWTHLIHGVPSAEYVAEKMSFTFHSSRASPPSDDATHPSNLGYRKQMTGLKGELFEDAAREAEILMSRYLTGKDKSGVVKKREKISWKTLRPLKRIAEKLTSFSFLDPTVEPLAQMITHVLRLLPQNKPIDGVGLMYVWTLAQALADPEKAMNIARVAFDSGLPSAAFEQLVVPELDSAADSQPHPAVPVQPKTQAQPIETETANAEEELMQSSATAYTAPQFVALF